MSKHFWITLKFSTLLLLFIAMVGLENIFSIQTDALQIDMRTDLMRLQVNTIKKFLEKYPEMHEEKF